MAFISPSPPSWLTGSPVLTPSAAPTARRPRPCHLRRVPPPATFGTRASAAASDSPDFAADIQDAPPERTNPSDPPVWPEPLEDGAAPNPSTSAEPADSASDEFVQHLDPPLCDDEVCIGEFLHSASLAEYAEQRAAGLLGPALPPNQSEFDAAWALAVSERKGPELKNQYSRVGILIERNFADFTSAEGCSEASRNATLEEIALVKARAVHFATGLPAIAETSDMAIDAPESDGRINKTLQHGYYTRDIENEADSLIERVRPVSDENRLTRFASVAAYYDGEVEITTAGSVSVAMLFSSAAKSTIATSAALDNLYKELSRQLGLTLDTRSRNDGSKDGEAEGERAGKVMVGATLLKERILRDGKVLGDGIIKVSSFLNHMVDTDLMEVCGEELAERLHHTMPSKLLTVESTGLIAGLPTARKLGIPLVFARKSRPITISDSYQTTYRSATKGTTSELIVSCEYLESGDRVLIIDDFLAGGSTAEALFKLAKMAHAKVVGVGVLIEKMSDGGRAFLSGYDVPVESLAKILPDGENKGRVNLMAEEPWVSPQAKLNSEQVKTEVLRQEAEFYSRKDRSGLEPAEASGGKDGAEESAELTRKAKEEEVKREVMEADAVSEDVEGESSVDILRWDDEEEDELDKLEDDLIREVPR